MPELHATPPTPPSWVEIDADFVAAQLSALGVSALPSSQPDDRVHEVYVTHWREHHRSPSLDHVSATAGVTLPALPNVLGRLQRAGRMIRLRRGEWLPVVTTKG